MDLAHPNNEPQYGITSSDVTPAEFEQFVYHVFSGANPMVEDLNVTLHESIEGFDGTYDFDGTVRYRLMGLAFLVLIEAKRHKNPIKRELVQVLNQKKQSVGAHKAVMFSTVSYQSGAVKYACTHGIALVSVMNGHLTYSARSSRYPNVSINSQAWDLHLNKGEVFGLSPAPNSDTASVISPAHPFNTCVLLLGIENPRL